MRLKIMLEDGDNGRELASIDVSKIGKDEESVSVSHDVIVDILRKGVDFVLTTIDDDNSFPEFVKLAEVLDKCGFDGRRVLGDVIRNM